MRKPRTVVLIGASVRALAFSALRVGLKPWCADLFADADLQARCPAVRLPMSDYPEGFCRLLKEAPEGPVIYTGGLENYPKLLARLAETRPVWGIQGEPLRLARSPFELAELLDRRELPRPRVASDTVELTNSCRWLAKPLRGTAGQGIHEVEPGSVRVRRGWYFQELIEGSARAAVYVGIRGSAYFLGVTQQLVGAPWLHSGPFQYCSSIGPVKLSRALVLKYRAIGQALVEERGLTGVFGVDLVIRNRTPYPVEVNPRWTASAEVLDYASGVAMMSYHRLHFVGGSAGDNAHPVPKGMVGKAILYAPRPLTFPAEGPWRREVEQPRDLWELPDFADIPHPGERFEKGQPVLTVFARARSVATCAAKLRQRAEEVYGLL